MYLYVYIYILYFLISGLRAKILIQATVNKTAVANSLFGMSMSLSLDARKVGHVGKKYSKSLRFYASM